MPVLIPLTTDPTRKDAVYIGASIPRPAWWRPLLRKQYEHECRLAWSDVQLIFERAGQAVIRREEITVRVGRSYGRRIVHCLPDGKIEVHAGMTCICDINRLLGSLDDRDEDSNKREGSFLPPDNVLPPPPPPVLGEDLYSSKGIQPTEPWPRK